MHALRNQLIISPDRSRSFTTAQVNAVTALDNIAASKLPPFGPQVTDIHNNSTTVASVVTVTMEDGVDSIYELAPNETRAIRIPIKAFKTASPATVTANCYWWAKPGPQDDKYSIADVP